MSALTELVDASRELEAAQREVAEVEPAYDAFFQSDVDFDEAPEQQRRAVTSSARQRRFDAACRAPVLTETLEEGVIDGSEPPEEAPSSGAWPDALTTRVARERLRASDPQLAETYVALRSQARPVWQAHLRARREGLAAFNRLLFPETVAPERTRLESGATLLSEPDPGPTPFLVEGLIVEGAITALQGERSAHARSSSTRSCA